MDKDVIENHEILYRTVKKSYPDAFINNMPSPALFMDESGLSVDRDGGREENKIIEKFKARFKDDYGGAVSVRASECRTIGTQPIAKPSKSNKYHAEIHESEDVVKISQLKALRLSQICLKINK